MDETQVASTTAPAPAGGALARTFEKNVAAAKAAVKPKAKKAAPVKAGKKVVKAAPKAKKATGPQGLLDPKKRAEYAQKYKKHKDVKTAGGSAVTDCDDKVAKAFRGKSLEEIYGITAKACEVPMTELKRKYGHLNLGMQRMNLSNKYRGVLNAK